jgi:hypothetical protein
MEEMVGRPVVNSLLQSEIDSCKYLYLREMGEPRDNQLRVVVEEAGTDPSPESRTIAGVAFTELHAIESNENSRLFEIIWEHCIAYNVMNESYARVDDYDVAQSGKLMRIYSKSRFLDYLTLATIASEDYPGPFKHYGLICLNHVIDVACSTPPTINLLRPRPRLN